MTEEHALQMRFDREQIEKRIDVASELFASGFNCAQSVVAAFADLYGVDRDLALRMAAPFGVKMISIFRVIKKIILF